MKCSTVLFMLFAGMVASLRAQNEPVLPPAQLEAPLQGPPLIIQAFSTADGGQPGAITIQTQPGYGVVGAPGGVFSAISPLLGGLGYMSRDQMLMRQDVQDDISLADDQIQTIRKLQQDYHKKMRTTMEGLKDVAPQQQGAFMREFMETNRVNFEKELKDVLHPAQWTRLQEIQFQSKVNSRGGNALFDAEVASALGLTDEQRKALMEKSRVAQQELNEKIQKLRQEMQEQLLRDVLTEEQVKMIEKLSGQKFEQQKRSSFQVLPPRP